jgi:hypothetical protein
MRTVGEGPLCSFGRAGLRGISRTAVNPSLEAAGKTSCFSRSGKSLSIQPNGRDNGVRDAGGRDNGVRDTDVRDAGGQDNGVRDTGVRDAGGWDNGGRDAGGWDAGVWRGGW